ncbi:aminotransferase class I/II-fold pyridoxal phosphate-dependent enzyme [Xylanibacter brevis]|uniref:aminotransferase class I/II-fold pyridoxal phosphate-dependent enzyme n=1 Tax=Xylanibacter brevis TaxID=83231 RepID=UPI000485A5BC|nr:aminotransferase class I/II-fold pyridoxal phosphate-dependent enzyme [Xylanibacter brevis]
MIQGHGDDAFRYEDIRMNFSSNIYAHADLTALKAFLAERMDVIAQYPEPDASSLAEVIAQKNHIPAGSVLVTNGAVEAIYLVAQMLAGAGIHQYKVTQPTFSEYEDACRMYGMEKGEHGVCWICNPNNPTGAVTRRLPLDDYQAVVIDQSYEDLTSAQLMSPAEAVAAENVIQIHSLTKTYAVPGLRVGYVVASESMISRLQHWQRPWSVNALAVEAGKWLLENEVCVVADMSAYLTETQRLNRALNQLPMVQALPTETNFMLARIEGATAAELKAYLAQEHRMLIRDASNFPGLNEHYFRISAQTPEENDALVAAIASFRQ